MHRGHVAPGHKGSQAMADNTLYEMLGLEPSAPLEAIQMASCKSNIPETEYSLSDEPI